MRQAARDLEQAEASRRDGRHEWACFACHQAAEKAVKAMHLELGQEAWGHVVRQLLESLAPKIVIDAELLDRARALDIHYIASRYADSHVQGALFEHYGDLQSREAIEHASRIVGFARSHVASP